MINFLEVWIAPPSYQECVCVCVCSCFRTVRSLYVLTDGFSLIFYLMLQEIKLKLDDMLRLQFRREKKN